MKTSIQDRRERLPLTHEQNRSKQNRKQNYTSKKSFEGCNTNSVQKMKSFAAQDQKVMQGDGEDPDSEGDQVPQGSPGQKDLLVNMGL